MKMTKISLALAMLGLSAVAFAGAPGNQVTAPSGINLIAPDSVGVWSIGLEAAYVEPTNNQYTYGQLFSPDGSYTRRSDRTVDQDWQWLGSVDLTYLFPGNSRDVKLSYTHLFEDTDSNRTRVGSGQVFTPSNFTVGNIGAPNLATISGVGTGNIADNGYARGSQETDYNSVDLVFGQWIKIGDRLDLHPFGGLRWAQVDTTDKARYYQYNTDATAGTVGNLSASQYSRIASNFSGIGPRAGFDTAVHLGSGFSIVGTFAGSLLIGDLDSSYRSSWAQYNPTSGATTSSGSFKAKSNNDNTAVVPELDARIGLDYMYAFTPSTSMNVQLGYQVVNYFNVTEADYQSAVGSTFGVIPNTTSSRQDWGYQGPYLRLQLNIA